MALVTGKIGRAHSGVATFTGQGGREHGKSPIYYQDTEVLIIQNM